MPKLKPCPFCGNKADYERPLAGHSSSRSDAAECTYCKFCLEYELDHGTGEIISAEEMWNARPEEKRLHEKIAKLKSIISEFTDWEPGVGLKEHTKPNHGYCCTCQTCGHHYDDCVCEHNEIENLMRSS